MRVCVLGAGIVGLATAYELNRAGHDGTVIDGAQPLDVVQLVKQLLNMRGTARVLEALATAPVLGTLEPN